MPGRSTTSTWELVIRSSLRQIRYGATSAKILSERLWSPRNLVNYDVGHSVNECEDAGPPFLGPPGST